VHPALKQIPAAPPRRAVPAGDSVAFQDRGIKPAPLRINTRAQPGYAAADNYHSLFHGVPCPKKIPFKAIRLAPNLENYDISLHQANVRIFLRQS
jgi:hypothetical protein